MLKPSDFNNAVPKFQNGTYANNPLDPTDVAEPTMEDYVRGVEPLDTLPAQWWNWLCNQFTSRFNKINTYVKNVFDELTQLLSLVGVTPDGTEGTITTGQLKNAFEQRYPNFLSKFIHTIAQIWSYTGSSTSGSVTTTQASRLAVFEKVTASDSSTSPATVTETYNTKYVDTLSVRLGGTGANTKQGALANLTCELTTPEVLPQDADVIINNNGVVQKTPVSSIVSYAGTVSIQNSTANCAIPVALCTGFTNVGKSNCCPLTYNPATGELKTEKLYSCCSRTTLYTRDVHFGVITGCYSYRLLQDITEWYNATNTVPVKQMVGNLFIHSSGWSVAKMYQVNMNHNPYRGGCPLSTDSDKEIFKVGAILGNSCCVFDKCTWPVIVCENATGKVYTAIRKKGQTQDVCVTFSGQMDGDPASCLVCNATNTPPTGWTVLLEAEQSGIISCADMATKACSFREVQTTMRDSCWLKLGSLICGYTGDILKFSLSRSYNFQHPEQHDITILAGKLTPASTRVIEDSNGCQLFSCIRFGYSSCFACPVDIYVKYNCACTNPVRISYCNTSPINGSFIPFFTQVSDACASACACTCNIPLHAYGHYINGCQFDTTCANTACVNASCYVCAGCVCATRDVCANCGSFTSCVRTNCVCAGCAIATGDITMSASNSPLNCITSKVLRFVEITKQCDAYACICSFLPNLVYRSIFPVQGFVCNISFDKVACNGIITCIGSITSNVCCGTLELHLGNSTNTLSISKTSTNCIGYPMWLTLMAPN